MSVLGVLVWKHAVVRRRRFLHSIFEFLSPAILFVLLYVIWRSVHSPPSQHDGQHGIEEPMQINSDQRAIKYPQYVYYYPSSESAKQLMEKASSRLKLAFRGPQHVEDPPDKGVWSFADEAQYIAYTNRSELAKKKFAGISFENLDDEAIPSSINYTIWLKEDFNTHTYVFEESLGHHEQHGVQYYGFVMLQWAIDASYLELRSNKTVTQELLLEHFPKPHVPHLDPAGKLFGQTLFTFGAWAPLAFLLYQVGRLTRDRHSGIQELIMMSGVHRHYITLGHVINAAPAWLVYVVAGTVQGVFLPSGSCFPLALMLFLYFLYVVILAFLCSAIAKKPSHAITVTMVIYMVTFSLSLALSQIISNSALLVLSGFLPHMPLAWLCRNMGGAVEFGADIRWGTIRSPIVQKSGSLTLAFIMMMLQIVLLAAVSEYLRLVRPGKYGVARPWNFCLRSSERVEPDSEGEQPVNRDDEEYFEKSPQDMPVGVSVRNITKVFGGHGRAKKVALDNVSLDIFQGEITVLLGHNGAGKTTLMSIITGMYSPTHGRALIGGEDVSNRASVTRKNVGLCPQHNLAFDDLTVREHFVFFGMLKGLSASKAAASSKRLLDQMNLTDKAHDMSVSLSGGMKRRLQLGCALVGDSPVLILDEPTSGLDVETRRELWNLLLSLRGDRTVLLTTHFMEEADALGDRVAALHRGRLRCHATPMFLKRAIGSGYRLSLSVERSYSKESILDAVARCLPDALLTEATATGVTFRLPADDTEKFPELFNHLEAKKDTLHINSMSVGVTTLEEVFLKLCSDECAEDEETLSGSADNKPPAYRRLTGAALLCQQFRALLTRQLKFETGKDFFVLFMEILFPIILMLFMAYHANGIEVVTDANPPRAMTPDLYEGHGRSTVYADIRHLAVDVRPLGSRYRDLSFVSSNDVVEDILSEGSVSMSNYDQLLFALQINDTEAIALYTTRVRHVIPVSVNLISNLLAQAYLQTTNPQLITVVNHPIPNQIYIERSKRPLEAKSYANCLLWAISLAAMCTAIMVPMATVSVLERASLARHLHVMSGVPCSLYFGAMLAFHVAMYAAVTLPTASVVAALMDMDSTFNNIDFIGPVFLMVLLYGVAFTSCIYVISCFTNEAGAAALLSLTSVMFGVIMPLVRMFTRELDITWLKFVQASAVHPTYAFSYALLKMTTAARYNRLCVLNKRDDLRLETVAFNNPHFDADKCRLSQNSNGHLNYLGMSYNGALPELVIMVVQVLVFWCIIMLLEKGVLNRWWDVILNRRYASAGQVCEDQWVAAERDYVHLLTKKGARSTVEDDALLVQDLHKQYRSLLGKPHAAVRGVSFSVKQGECFGLLGVNGAGKSTVFKMLTGTEHPTLGAVWANGLSLRGHRDQYLSTLAYCPQFGGLDEFLTGWDNVKLAALLRGVPPAAVEQEVRTWMDCVDMRDDGRRAARGYSGGCVRRCLTAATLAGVGGSRRLALLDEPTAGVDPGARRKVWSTLRQSLATGLSIVISSHSMDETEALCGRIAILSCGQIRALGSAAELRARHAAGYSAVIKLRQAPAGPRSLDQGDETDGSGMSTPLTPTAHSLQDQIRKVHEAVRKNFNAVVKDEHKSMLHYHLSAELSYSQVFRRMEALRRQLDGLVEDYTVSGTTLEEVFLSFAKDAAQESNSEV